MKKLIITADDYGPHPFINEGIHQAINAGVIDSTNVLVNYDDYKSGITHLRNLIGDKPVGIGLHLTISSMSPVSTGKVNSLTIRDEGDLFKLITDFNFRDSKTHLAELKLEIENQINRFQEAMNGEAIDHISVHHSTITLYEPYFQVMIEVLKKMNIKAPFRNPLIISKDKRFNKWFSNSGMKKSGLRIAIANFDDNVFQTGRLLHNASYDSLKERGNVLRANGNPVTHYMFDNFYKRASPEDLSKTFNHFPDRYVDNFGEMVVHLGAGDLEFNKTQVLHGIDTNYFEYRVKELTTLKEFKFLEAMQINAVERIKFGALQTFEVRE